MANSDYAQLYRDLGYLVFEVEASTDAVDLSQAAAPWALFLQEVTALTLTGNAPHNITLVDISEEHVPTLIHNLASFDLGEDVVQFALAVESDDALVFVNDGTIRASSGLVLFGGGYWELHNHGLISGTETALTLVASGTLDNGSTGVILGGINADGSTFFLQNDGRIGSEEFAAQIYVTSAYSKILNAGVIDGYIEGYWGWASNTS